MTDDITLDKLARGVRSAAGAEPLDHESAIERYLERELEQLPPEERLSVVGKIALRFTDRGKEPVNSADTNATAELLSLLLGKEVSLEGLSNGESAENFARALNTVFNSLNRIVGGINVNLFGQNAELETIRHVIGSQIVKSGKETSLQSYLQQIQQSFLLAHTAFQEASLALTREILTALDPTVCEESVKSSMKFGPLRKAEYYEVYRQKYRECGKWVDSGRYSERLLREFEKICQKKSKSIMESSQ
jgi:hypothetical protein